MKKFLITALSFILSIVLTFISITSWVTKAYPSACVYSICATLVLIWVADNIWELISYLERQYMV